MKEGPVQRTFISNVSSLPLYLPSAKPIEPPNSKHPDSRVLCLPTDGDITIHRLHALATKHSSSTTCHALTPQHANAGPSATIHSMPTPTSHRRSRYRGCSLSAANTATSPQSVAGRSPLEPCTEHLRCIPRALVGVVLVGRLGPPDWEEWCIWCWLLVVFRV